MVDEIKERILVFEISGLIHHQVYDTVKKLELIQNKYTNMNIDSTNMIDNINTVTCTTVLSTIQFTEAMELYKLLSQFPLPNPCKDEEHKIYSSTIHSRLSLEDNIYKRK